jgi:acetate kinase
MVVMAVGRKFVFIVNPGSASRKYAIFSGLNQIAMVHFELIDNLVVANLSHFDNKYVIKYNDGNLANVPHRILPLLIRYGVMTRNDEVSAIGIRTVARVNNLQKMFDNAKN